MRQTVVQKDSKTLKKKMDLKLNPNPKQFSKLKAPEEGLYSNFKTELYLFLFHGLLNLRGITVSRTKIVLHAMHAYL